MPNVRTDEAIHGLMGVTARMAGAMAWLVIAVAHLGLVLTLLVSAWLWRLTPAMVSRAGQAIVPDRVASSAFGTALFLGVPIVIGLWLYVRVWKWLLRRLVLRYLLRSR